MRLCINLNCFAAPTSAISRRSSILETRGPPQVGDFLDSLKCAVVFKELASDLFLARLQVLDRTPLQRLRQRQQPRRGADRQAVSEGWDSLLSGSDAGDVSTDDLWDIITGTPPPQQRRSGKEGDVARRMQASSQRQGTGGSSGWFESGAGAADGPAASTAPTPADGDSGSAAAADPGWWDDLGGPEVSS